MKVNGLMTAVFGMQLLAGLAAMPALAAGNRQTLTGQVSDSMCGARHQMPGDPAACARACLRNGSKFALVVGAKVYTLETSDKATFEKLFELAGSSAKITGDVDGGTIVVKSVAE
jgi:hypothetical protein